MISPQRKSASLQLADFAQGVRRWKDHVRSSGAVRAVAHLSRLRDICFVSPTSRTNANFSASKRFIATGALWYAMSQDPNDASAFTSGGKPTWSSACRKCNIVRTAVLRIAGGVLFTEWALLAPALLAWCPKQTPFSYRVSHSFGLVARAIPALGNPSKPGDTPTVHLHPLYESHGLGQFFLPQLRRRPKVGPHFLYE